METKTGASPDTLKALKEDNKLIEKDSKGFRTLGLREILLIEEGVKKSELTNLNPKSDKLLFLYLRIGSKKKYEDHLEQRRQDILQTIDEDTMIDEGKKVYDDGNIYEGEFRDGMCHGKGVLKFKQSGNVYDGQFKEGFMHGIGKMNFKNGTLYEGDFYFDFMHGTGLWKDPEGNQYKGDFAGDSRTGEAVVNYNNGDVYEGEFLLNKKEGNGIFKTEEFTYDGEFYNDKFAGLGEMKFGKGKQLHHKGMYLDGQKHGKGEMTTYEGKKYKTTWLNGKKHGRFTLETTGSIAEGVFNMDELEGDITTKFDNGDIYVGNSLNSYREGSGRMVWANHKTLKVYEGTFRQNKMHGHGKLEMKNGLIYEGEMENNQINGKGCIYNDNFKATGNFSSGKPVGLFKIVYDSGDVYEGGFPEFKRAGHGKLVKKNGVVYEGQYSNNKMHGKGVLTIEEKVYSGEWKLGKREGKFEMVDSKTGQKFEVFFEKDKRTFQQLIS